LIIVLAGTMSAGAFCQTGIHGPSLSGAQIAGVVAGCRDWHGSLFHPPQAVVGCVQSSKGTSSLIDEKDNRTYVPNIHPQLRILAMTLSPAKTTNLIGRGGAEICP
jgi:hypothetical protein